MTSVTSRIRRVDGPQAAHSTLTRWLEGCDCDGCWEAQNDAARARFRRRAQARLPLEVRYETELVRLAETRGKACGAAQTATPTAESGTRSGVQKRPSGTTHPPDHPGTQPGKRSPVAAALINSALGSQEAPPRSSVCTPKRCRDHRRQGQQQTLPPIRLAKLWF
jgi:hypothetical protein